MLIKDYKKLGYINLSIASIWAMCFSLNLYSFFKIDSELFSIQSCVIILNLICTLMHVFNGMDYLSKYKEKYNLETEKSLIELTEKLKIHQSEQSINS